MIDFAKDVLRKSYELPVLVDFWAPWCGPCRILSPVLDKIAEEQAGQWALVKLNTEEQPDLAEQYRVRSIPNVKLFYRGEVIEEFLGALPRQMILDWLRKNLPDEGIRALDQVLAETNEPTVAQLEELTLKYPATEAIRLVHSQLILWDRPGEALALLEPIKLGSPFYDKAVALRDIIAFLLTPTDDPDVKNIQDLLLASRTEASMPDIMQLLAKDTKVAEGKLAKAAIGIFNTLGPQHPLTKQYRRQLDMYLWS